MTTPYPTHFQRRERSYFFLLWFTQFISVCCFWLIEYLNWFSTLKFCHLSNVHKEIRLGICLLSSAFHLQLHFIHFSSAFHLHFISVSSAFYSHRGNEDEMLMEKCQGKIWLQVYVETHHCKQDTHEVLGNTIHRLTDTLINCKISQPLPKTFSRSNHDYCCINSTFV